MDKHQIGVNAGKVWKLLNDNKRWSYCDSGICRDYGSIHRV